MFNGVTNSKLEWQFKCVMSAKYSRVVTKLVMVYHVFLNPYDENLFGCCDQIRITFHGQYALYSVLPLISDTLAALIEPSSCRSRDAIPVLTMFVC